MNTNPKVSIIIPVYNGENYVSQAIDSALAQTYDNIEVIVVNDGSRDDMATERVVLSYGDRVRYIKKENGGVSSALNLGIKSMTGEYFSWLSHDDRYLPDKVKSQVEELQKFGDDSLIALCESCQIDKDSNRLSDFRSAERFETGKLIPWQNALISLMRNGSFNGCALLIPKKVFDECGGFDETLRYAQDWLMWLNSFMHKYSLVYSGAQLVENRIHNKQLTQTGRELFHKDSSQIGRQVLPRLSKLCTKEHNFLYHFAYYNAIYNNHDVVKSTLKEGKATKMLGFSSRLKLRTVLLYGKIRPLIRKVYYLVFKRVKTK